MSTYTLSFHTTHNSGAALLEDDKVVAAASEERFNRIKHYGYLPYESIQYCLDEADITPDDIDQLAIPSDVVPSDVKVLLDWDDYDTNPMAQGDQPFLKKLKKTVAERGRGFKNPTSIPDYARTVRFPDDLTLRTVNHHEAHAASAYYTCGQDEVLVVTSDGLGDDIATTVWHGHDGELNELLRVGKEGSLGWFYGVVTQALGWWVGNGEGKTMGLSSYGDASEELVDELRTICPEYRDGQLTDPVDFDYPGAWRVKDTYHWDFAETAYVEDLLERYEREDVADAAQRLLEEQLLNLVGYWLEETGTQNVALAGGVFLNVAVNRELLYNFDIEHFHAFPAAGDDGLPAGAALSAYYADNPTETPTHLTHPDLGPGFTNEEIKTVLEGRKLEDERPDSITDTVADLLLDDNIVAWFQGRMEYGPRALGNRSILIDPQRDDAMDRVNAEIKFRDSWRPFAPSMLNRAIEEYLVDPYPDPFMITSYDVKPEKHDEIPAVTHVDGTTRPQVVTETNNPRYHDLIDTFDQKGGVPLVLNTSFNLSGDPIVCSVEDAVGTFYNCGLDALAIGDYLLRK